MIKLTFWILLTLILLPCIDILEQQGSYKLLLVISYLTAILTLLNLLTAALQLVL